MHADRKTGKIEMAIKKCILLYFERLIINFVQGHYLNINFCLGVQIALSQLGGPGACSQFRKFWIL